MKIHSIWKLSALSVLLFLCGCGTTKYPLIEKGMQYMESLEYEEAIAQLEQADAQDNKEKRQVLRGTGIANMGLAEYGTAIEKFKQCLSLSTGIIEDLDYDVNFFLAAAYLKCEDYQEAVNIYDAIIALQPQNAEALFLRGNAYLYMDNPEAAKRDFDQVILIKPNDFDRLIAIYEVLEGFGLEEDGKGYLSAALEKRATSMSVFNQGRVQFYLGNYKEAQALLAQAKPESDPLACLYLGMAYEATGDYQYAMTNIYNSYLSKQKPTARIYNQLGLCRLKQGEYPEALETFQAALKMKDADILQTLQYNEIVAYEYLLEFEKAKELMAGYLKAYPDDETAKREYEFLMTR